MPSKTMENLLSLEWVENLAKKIRERNAKKVLLQLPEGLKFLSPAIIDRLSEHGIDAVSWMEPTYGACDIVPDVAKQLGMDLLVHIGHVKFYRNIPDSNVLYFPIYIDIDASKYTRLLDGIEEESVLVISTVQHMKSIGGFVEELEKRGKRARNGGYVLGCFFPRVEEDAVLFIGSGEFHPSGIPALSVSAKPVYVLDIEKSELRKLDAGKWERRRMARIAKAANAETFGIIISTKHGQKELIGNAYEIKKRLEKMGKRAYVLALNHISDWKLEGLNVDCIINTACPRIADDPHEIVMINATDLDELERIWDAVEGAELNN